MTLPALPRPTMGWLTKERRVAEAWSANLARHSTACQTKCPAAQRNQIIFPIPPISSSNDVVTETASRRRRPREVSLSQSYFGGLRLDDRKCAVTQKFQPQLLEDV